MPTRMRAEATKMHAKHDRFLLENKFYHEQLTKMRTELVNATMLLVDSMPFVVAAAGNPAILQSGVIEISELVKRIDAYIKRQWREDKLLETR